MVTLKIKEGTMLKAYQHFSKMSSRSYRTILGVLPFGDLYAQALKTHSRLNSFSSLLKDRNALKLHTPHEHWFLQGFGVDSGLKQLREDDSKQITDEQLHAQCLREKNLLEIHLAQLKAHPDATQIDNQRLLSEFPEIDNIPELDDKEKLKWF